MGKTEPQIKDKDAGLLMLRMEIKAIRDRVLLDLDAALAKIDAVLPPIDPERYKPRTSAEYREMYRNGGR